MKRRIFWIALPVLILAVLAALLLEQALPFGVLFFETIDQKLSGLHYMEKIPAIMVIASVEEVGDPGLGVRFPPDVLQRLESIDYRRYFVLCVFQGRHDSTGPRVEIQYLLRQGNTITVQAEFTRPQLTNPATSSPYHLVRVPKGQLSGTYSFILRSETGETAEATHTIP